MEMEHHSAQGESDPIEFTPLDKGLGFHPEEDESKRKVVTPSFAQTSAVIPPPLIMPAPTLAPPPQLPSSTPSLETREAPAPTLQNFPNHLSEHMDPSEGLSLGYSLKRVMAYLLDTLINVGLGSFTLMVSLYTLGIRLKPLLGSWPILLGFTLFLSWAIILAQEIAYGTSMGKRVFELTLQGDPVALLSRGFLFLLSAGAFGLGLLWALFNSQRRCLHDSLTSLQPEEIARF